MQQKIIGFSLLLIFFFSGGCKKDNDIPQNAVPIVNSGVSKITTLPADSVTVNGSATDSDGQIVAYLWSKISGPSSPTIVNPGSATTVIKGLLEGNYVFQLMATDDKGATGVDTMAVHVNPSPITTITLQPSNNSTEWALITNNGQDQSVSNRPDIPVETWTFNGGPVGIREVIKFDLSSIPTNATIQNATLTLYSYPSPTLNGNLIDANSGTSNAMLVQQVSSNWSPGSINWSNQPTATSVNQVIVPGTTQSTLDLNLNVTAMVSSMVNNNSNYGFFLRLQNEVPLNCRIFVSSYNTTYPTKHPKLVITYQP